MPSYSKTVPNNLKTKPDPTPEFPDFDNAVADQEASTKAGRRKSKNAAAKLPANVNATGKAPDPEVTLDSSSSSPNPPSILGQLPHAFAHQRKNTNLEVLEELNATEKVSDEHTPPQETYLYGRSPPTDLASGLSHTGSPPVQHAYTGRGGFNSIRSPPTSPPQAKARPVSYGGRTSSFSTHPRASTSPYGYVGGAYGSPPALPPHLPQQHFYAARDVDLGLGFGSQTPVKQRQQSLVKFAKLPGTGREHREALILGSEGGLEVLSYDGEQLTHIGQLKGLSGTVVDAIFLSWNDGVDPYEDLRPLLAVTVHGYIGHIDLADGRSPGRISNRDFIAPYGYPGVAQEGGFATSVAVYSLAKTTLVAELLCTPFLNLPQMSALPSVSSTTPRSRFTLQSSGNFLTVSSTSSGEIWVFSPRQSLPDPQFECLGKFWTALQPRLTRRDSSHSRASDTDVSPADITRGPDDGESPILSLNGRWLAYCPASTPSRPSLGASMGEAVFCGRAINLSTGSAPSRPSLSCEVESPDVETLLGRVARGVAQEFLKGSKWLGEKGVQTWQNYWKKETPSPALGATPYTSPLYSPQPPAAQFPPTHADLTQAASTEPEIVTIIDLKSLQMTESKKPLDNSSFLATFQPPGGCSFVSFMPNGLGLLTASRKGDLHYIWDLIQSQYPRNTVLAVDADNGRSSARVRQIAKYARLSPSIIVDIAWEPPIGARFAVLTQNRTIHIFDLPLNALRWPPPRAPRKVRPASASMETSPGLAQHDQTATAGFFASAINLAGKTQPVIANLRGRAPSMGGGFSGIGSSGIGLASATGFRGGKAVAAGLSKSLGAATDTVANIRHAGQSKLHLKIDAVAGRLSWHWRGQRPVLSVLDASGVRNYYVRKTNPRENRQLETVSVFDARKAVASKLPKDLGTGNSKGEDKANDYGQENVAYGFWKPNFAPQRLTRGIQAPLSQAEIETNAPYQPFHSDHRVTMSVYSEGQRLGESQFPTASALLQPPITITQTPQSDQWVFGLAIATTKLNTGPSKQDDSDDRKYGSIVYRETTMAPTPGDDETEQIVSTTRRRKKKNADAKWDDSEGAEQEGFFEDDCDVLDFATDRV